MYSPRIKRGVFWLEGINGLATTWYFYFIFFIFEQQFGFDDKRNLLVAAAMGAVFTFGSILGGRVGQRRGYFHALTVGFSVMAGALFCGAFLPGVAAQMAVLLTGVFGMCFTWANLEALAAEGESPKSLQRSIGIYNLIWSMGNGVGYFTGGALIEYLGPKSIFLIPASLQIVQLILTLRLNLEAKNEKWVPPGPLPQDLQLSSSGERRRSPVPPAVFLQLAWVANPFSYVAINTALPLIPFLAGRLELTPAAAGVVCSMWFFARTLAFGLLWKWDGWHYRYRFLAVAYVAMAAGFGGIVLAGSIAMLVVAQILFGFGLGLIYYSSLFYSMDVGEAKGDHGGLHEGAIGAGLFAGPAIAFAALHLWPDDPDAGIKAVAALLAVGFLWLIYLRFRKSVDGSNQ
jgi:MFS family permease